MTLHSISNSSRTLRLVGADIPEHVNDGLTADRDDDGWQIDSSLAMDDRTRLTCGRCEVPFTIPAASWHVEDILGPVCDTCAHADPDLAPLQRHAEISRLIDAHLAQFDDRDRREAFARRIARDAEWFASWRHEDQEPIDLGLGEDVTPRSSYAPHDDDALDA